MAVTDLTGTKWRWNSNPMFGDDVEAPLEYIDALIYAYDSTAWSEQGDREYFEIGVDGVNAGHLNFTSNNENFVGLVSRSYEPLDGGNYIGVYEHWGDGWTNEAYRAIEITGGTDATNATLISFMQSNAEQIIDSPVLPSFSDVEVTPHEGYITMTINGVDFNLKTAASVSLISFSIEGITYQGEDGMTWGEWVASEYNTSGFAVDTDRITIEVRWIRYANNIDVSPNDTIQSGYEYVISGGGSSD